MNFKNCMYVCIMSIVMIGSVKAADNQAKINAVIKELGYAALMPKAKVIRLFNEIKQKGFTTQFYKQQALFKAYEEEILKLQKAYSYKIKETNNPHMMIFLFNEYEQKIDKVTSDTMQKMSLNS